MIRVVVDTNVLVSALLTEHGAEAEVLALIVATNSFGACPRPQWQNTIWF